ncbi:MAG: hypothetical protein VKK97_11455, partial [Synechococcaceae cyanobacterium]|nr:hypothetical protein [Synechococcaceae cyanobacterium]
KAYFQRLKSLGTRPQPQVSRSALVIDTPEPFNPADGAPADGADGTAASTTTIAPAQEQPMAWMARSVARTGIPIQPRWQINEAISAAAGAGPQTDLDTTIGSQPWLDRDGLNPAAAEVIDQGALAGSVPELITVAERLPQVAAVQTNDYVINDRRRILEGLGNQEIFKDLVVPGLPELTFGAVRDAGGLLPAAPTPPGSSDELALFSSAVASLDLTVAALRLGEGRVRQIRQAISLCLGALVELRQQREQLEQRLRQVEIALAEASQDLAVAEALQAEDRERVEAINNRRKRILRDHVAFLAFQRPRSLDLRRPTAWLPLDHGGGADPLPPCLADGTPIPREVRAMVDLLREAPLGWFSGLVVELRRLDRIDTLVRLFNSAALRRQQLTTPQPTLPQLAALNPQGLSASELGDAPIGRSIGRLFGQRQLLLRQRRQRQTPPTVEQVAAQSWQESLRQAEVFLTLGDLLAGDHHRPELSALAAGLQERWCQVAACLKQRFGAIDPGLRLAGAERLSQFDGPVDLRQLAGLPRWGEAGDGPQRRALQSLVDWLFQQVNGELAEAVAFANDLVRLALLLACHAPVNQILSGQVIGNASLAPEARLPIRIDPLRVRIGMPMVFHGDAGVVAEGVVEDLSGTVATARILRGDANRMADERTRVQILRQSLS